MSNSSRRIQIICENLDVDVKQAAQEGLTHFELTALVGSIAEDLLRSLPKGIRRPAWDTVCKIMDNHFESGDI